MKAIVKKVEKKFWIAQAIAALMGLSAIIVWARCPGLLLLAEVLGCAAAACLLTVRMYYQNKLGALDQAFDALHRTGAKTVPVFAGYTCYGRVFEDWNGDVHFVEAIGKW